MVVEEELTTRIRRAQLSGSGRRLVRSQVRWTSALRAFKRTAWLISCHHATSLSARSDLKAHAWMSPVVDCLFPQTSRIYPGPVSLSYPRSHQLTCSVHTGGVLALHSPRSGPFIWSAIRYPLLSFLPRSFDHAHGLTPVRSYHGHLPKYILCDVHLS